MGTVSIHGMVAVWGGHGGGMGERMESHASTKKGEARVPWEGGRARAGRMSIAGAQSHLSALQK